MIKQLRIHFNQILEIWETHGFFSVLHEAVYINRGIVPVEKDLNSLKPLKLSPNKLKVEFIEIEKDSVENRRLEYPLKSRYLKLFKNLDKGYKGFAIVEGNQVIGDLWYFSSNKSMPTHPDLKLLNIHFSEKDVYLFDMYIKPEKRGEGRVTSLLGEALMTLKNKGFKKAYGYYMADNIPALWMHRMLGYKELHRLKWNRFIFLKWRADKK